MTTSKPLGHVDVRGCASVFVCLCVCVYSIQPLRCSPPGLLDIISHYPRHSSNSAGARERRSLAGALLPHVYIPFFLLLFHGWAFPNENSLEAEGDANLYILVEHADIVSGERKRKGNK